MRIHERVPIEQLAARDLAEVLDRLFPVGAVVEEACVAVAEVERACLRRSNGDANATLDTANGPAWGLWGAVCGRVDEHGLTWGEAARIVHHLSDSWLNLIVRIERHGDREDARADLAYEEGS